MLNYIFFSIGIIIIFLSLLLIKKEIFENYSGNNLVHDEKYLTDTSNVDSLESIDFLETINSIENIINELNISFKETVDEIEKKYTYLEKNIEKLNTKLNENKKLLDNNINKIENSVELSKLAYKNITKDNTMEDDNYKQEIKEDIIKINDTDSKDEKRKKVLNLKQKGYTTSQIAKILNMGFDEVQFILSINKK
ncbi:hypothetical protein SAMN02745883_00128 [Caminicella sporogenes DSM 14501]|uniref:Uncharacterized protein n=1 Tax=Caminicella sporogenes DSM 14501 TaxID=1121266 RepID=A0A1M6L9T7_9FIRM|nr:hypothetical protein [Caminicella sporogenes]RKD27757.1 hypothetical protein BET04_01440 [Caminicella sporogenes]WIF94666.1 hypothetical protein QNI18_10425 [Caminicella sporogenes]SHJ67957.1 hypothetical protein SAMN02745883_00128 [Caminicella sporogenes DSM 14501]